jgi:hypothetical protein
MVEVIDPRLVKACSIRRQALAVFSSKPSTGTVMSGRRPLIKG